MNHDVVRGKLRQLAGRLAVTIGRIKSDQQRVAWGEQECVAGHQQENYGWARARVARHHRTLRR